MAEETSTTTADPGTTGAETAGELATTAAAITTDEFQNIPLDRIIIEDQIRSDAGVDDEESQGFVDSIAAKGFLESIIVTPRRPRRAAARPKRPSRLWTKRSSINAILKIGVDKERRTSF